MCDTLPFPTPGDAKRIRRATIDRWHFVFAGYLQHEGQPNGMVRLWWELHRRHAGCDTAVLFERYDAPVDLLAEMVWRLRANGGPTICIYGYSWGGAAAVNFARALDRRGIRVASMVLSDPVYRHWHLLGRWRALFPWSRIARIRVPANVAAMHSFWQRRNWPRACQLVADDPSRTKIHRPKLATVEHGYMDDLRAFHDASLNLARQAA